MFGKVINKIGVVANNQNSAYHHLHRIVSEYTDNIKDGNTSVFYGDIHNRIFADSLKNKELSSDDIRFMKVYNRDISK